MGFARFVPGWTLLLVGAVVLGGCSSRTDGLLNGEASLNTARVALSSGAAEVALDICLQRLEKRPRDVDLLVCKGDALAQLRRGTEAGAAYDSALREDRGSAEARLGLGRLRLATDPRAAEALFLETLARSPRNAAALNNLGIARDLQGRHADAQTAYAEAIAIAPEMRAALVNLGLSLAMSGKPGEAVRILRPIGERTDATARERHDLAAALAIQGQGEEAARLLRPELDGSQADDAVSGYRLLPSR